ncbi:TRAP transporter substrate-binding protein [Shouchella sp. 1P09AA]|uniref:TRAP transporter substrate-binding protein n=1 Tax=unclassified Shouchella TaxID=2893065 RepID=UPI0039A0F8C4
MKQASWVIASVFVLSACGGGSASGGEVTLSLGHIANEKDAWHKGAIRFAELVEEKTDGSVTVDVFPSSQLGSDRDLIEGMQLGTVDFALVAGVLSNFHEPFSILELPYLFEDEAHLENVLYGEVGDGLKEELLAETDVRGLEFWMRGPRQLTAHKAVESPEALSGLKIRVPEIPASISAWEEMGAAPTAMAFGEVYSSLQTGVIDGQENPLALIESNTLQEVQDYLMLTNHVYGYVMLTMSEATYQKLSPEQQEAVEAAAQEATEYENALVAEMEVELLATLEEAGMTVIEPDTEPFNELATRVHGTYAERYGQDLYDAIVAAADE